MYCGSDSGDEWTEVALRLSDEQQVDRQRLYDATDRKIALSLLYCLSPLLFGRGRPVAL